MAPGSQPGQNYSREQVRRAFKLSDRQLSSWEAQGLLPATETIQRYDIAGNDFTPVEVAPDGTKTVLLGIRPCDAASLTLMDTVFNWDFEDVFYNTRRQGCTVVPLACTRADESCFCTSVGLSPDSARNADAMLMFAEGGKKLVLSPVTDKGRELAASAGPVES